MRSLVVALIIGGSAVLGCLAAMELGFIAPPRPPPSMLLLSEPVPLAEAPELLVARVRFGGVEESALLADTWVGFFPAEHDPEPWVRFETGLGDALDTCEARPSECVVVPRYGDATGFAEASRPRVPYAAAASFVRVYGVYDFSSCTVSVPDSYFWTDRTEWCAHLLPAARLLRTALDDRGAVWVPSAASAGGGGYVGVSHPYADGHDWQRTTAQRGLSVCTTDFVTYEYWPWGMAFSPPPSGAAGPVHVVPATSPSRAQPATQGENTSGRME